MITPSRCTQELRFFFYVLFTSTGYILQAIVGILVVLLIYPWVFIYDKFFA